MFHFEIITIYMTVCIQCSTTTKNRQFAAADSDVSILLYVLILWSFPSSSQLTAIYCNIISRLFCDLACCDICVCIWCKEALSSRRDQEMASRLQAIGRNIWVPFGREWLLTVGNMFNRACLQSSHITSEWAHAIIVEHFISFVDGTSTVGV